MILTKAHIRFWSEKHLPRFAQFALIKGERPLIHDCVNDHDPTTFGPKKLALSNLLSLMRLARANGERLSHYLYHLDNPYCERARRVWVKRFSRRLRRKR